MVKKRLFSLFVFILLAGSLILPANAATKVKIVGKKFVADTFHGVSAYYDESEDGYYGRWQCFEYVQRFYSEAYDLKMYAYNGCEAPIMETQGYGFKKTKKPKPGDLLYSPAERRGKPYSHWAIVKTSGNGIVTLAEQNHHWNGTVVVDRETLINDPKYDFFTPIGIGKSNPKLGGSHQEEAESVGILQWFKNLFTLKK